MTTPTATQLRAEGQSAVLAADVAAHKQYTADIAVSKYLTPGVRLACIQEHYGTGGA